MKPISSNLKLLIEFIRYAINVCVGFNSLVKCCIKNSYLPYTSRESLAGTDARYGRRIMQGRKFIKFLNGVYYLWSYKSGPSKYLIAMHNAVAYA